MCAVHAFEGMCTVSTGMRGDVFDEACMGGDFSRWRNIVNKGLAAVLAVTSISVRGCVSYIFTNGGKQFHMKGITVASSFLWPSTTPEIWINTIS